jgi:DNA-binding NarL/FixJ family response regulator
MKVFVIDDHVLFREGIASLLKTQDDMELVGESDMSDHAIQKAALEMPDIILMDVGNSHVEGVSLMKHILLRQPEISFMILAAHDSDDLLYDMIANGARGYLPKNITKSILLAALRALGRGEAVIPRGQVSKILDEFSRLGKLTVKENIQEKNFNLLTYRELEVLDLLVSRATNREIATKLSISENTVRVHVSNILEKLNLRSRREASLFAKQITMINSTLTSTSK